MKSLSFALPSILAPQKRRVVDSDVILCSSEDCETEAERLQNSLIEAGYIAILLSTQADRQEEIESTITRSRALLLLQSAGVLLQPYVLLQVYSAYRASIPIVPINVQGKGYNFAQANSTLANLEMDMSTQSLQVLRYELRRQQLGLRKMKRVLKATIPNKISVPYLPNSSETQIVATIADIFDKVARLEQLENMSPLLRISSFRVSDVSRRETTESPFSRGLPSGLQMLSRRQGSQ
eukprot:1458718-Prymnesium_polylepis.1